MPLLFSVTLGHSASGNWIKERTRPLDGITDSMSVSELWEMVKGREARHAAAHGVPKSRTRLSDCIQQPRREAIPTPTVPLKSVT